MKKNRTSKMTVMYFVLAAILAALSASFAAYTSLSSVKRVVTVKGTEQFFTSDVLLEYEGDTLQTRVISFADNTEQKSFSIKISNHIQGDVTKFDTQQITYTLSVTLTDSAGNPVTDSDIYRQYSVTTSNNDSIVMSANPLKIQSETLPGGAGNDNLYTFVLPGTDLSVYKLRITAVPDRTSYKPIGRLISFTADSTSANWTGSFMDAEKAYVEEGQELGMINYKIHGQMEEDCVLIWDSSRVEVDPRFLQDMNVTPISDSGSKKKINLHLGAAGTPGQYIITFYRTYAVQDLSETWNDIISYISFQNSVNG